MALTKDPLIGRLVASKYRVASRLGIGAMATIYRARDPTGHMIALKIVKASIVRNKTAAARFHREAKAASRLKHDGIVEIFDWGFDDQLPYIAMELVEGEDLFELLDRRGALTEREALEVIIALCEALDVAHEQGVVHRDLKPENIMVGGVEAGSGKVHIKVLDFGIAKLLGPEAGDMWSDETVPQQLTKVGSAVGTPSHMAPEQARGDPVDGRTDIYALGVLLYEMVTGHLPFEGDNPLHVAIRQVRDPPPPPTQHVPDLHPDLAAIILRMLEKAPEARFQKVASLKAALVDVLVDIDPDHQTHQREARHGEDDAQTVQREAPEAEDDLDPPTAQHEIPASLRGMIDKRNKVPPAVPSDPATIQRAVPRPDDEDDEGEEPLTMELDTVAGKTMRREVRDRLNAAIAAADAADLAQVPDAEESKPTLVDEPSHDRTPFVGRANIPRPGPRRAGAASPDGGPDSEPEDSVDLSIETAVKDAPAVPPAPPSGVTSELEPDDYDIEDEDSEGAIATVVADPQNLTGDAARVVLEARAKVEAELSAAAGARIPARTVTQQSQYGGPAHGNLGQSGPAPSVQVIHASTDSAAVSQMSYSGPNAAAPSSMSGSVAATSMHSMSGAHPPVSGQMRRRPANTQTSGLPIGQWSSSGPNTRGAANELEHLLKQMPRQRQPIVGSVVVLVLLGVAIVALIYLLVGAATF